MCLEAKIFIQVVNCNYDNIIENWSVIMGIFWKIPQIPKVDHTNVYNFHDIQTFPTYFYDLSQ